MIKFEMPIKKPSREGGEKIHILIPDEATADEVNKAIKFLKYILKKVKTND